MAASQALHRVEGQGWSRGLRTILRREIKKWWGTRRWLLQTLIWVLFLDGMVVLGLYVLPQLQDPSTGEPALPGEPLQTATEMIFALGMMALAIGVVILMQNVIIDEKQTGTIEWVLSKPLSRTAFIVAKLIANSLGVLVTMFLIPGTIAFALLWTYEPGGIPLTNFLAGQGIMLLHTFFYLTLVLMLGVLVNGRATVLAVALGTLFIGQMIPIASVVQFTPWVLFNVTPLVVQGQPLPTVVYAMLVSTAVWSVVFIAVAIWRFNKLEF